MDALDQASELDMRLCAAYVGEQVAKNKRHSHHESLTHCLECGDAIPKARQEAQQGCEYCVTCQELDDKGKL
ncbi:TraR/DksA C4-type zinc finger protein [Aliivibrio logei]|uniref:Zinc finger DksA/TraR C4-type domain-containing protein n=1 Tax=Aliivibrio logei 5S-186 TaxID=626086 RepID=A0ABX3AU63_ALILO|nr:TraR/DksA C4-type zinc finger protein [Aliivibrio logei]OEF12760.1 hypothetical protein A1Q5_08570 [Aliivibrio logei 5S-186]